MDAGPERALAHVDLAAVRRNCSHLRSGLTGGAALGVVVKADGYGHGAVWAAQAAIAGGASWIAVATAEEAAELRLHGISTPVLVMGALTPAGCTVALEAAADVVAWDVEFVRALARRAGAHGPGGRARVHVKIDTGMGRLGVLGRDAALAVARAVEEADALDLVGAMTHFATADERGDDYFPAQAAEFDAFVAALRPDHPSLIAHAANSAATLRDPAVHHDLVRCGVAVYGLDPFQRDPAEQGLEPALSLGSFVAAVKRFEPGRSAGYGRTWSAQRATDVGVVPVGYGDGWRRALSNRSEVLVAGCRRPVVGTVSMDNLTVDLGTGSGVRPGDPVVLIGAQGKERILCEEVARRLDTINYEITCGLTPRVRRAYAAHG